MSGTIQESLVRISRWCIQHQPGDDGVKAEEDGTDSLGYQVCFDAGIQSQHMSPQTLIGRERNRKIRARERRLKGKFIFVRG